MATSLEIPFWPTCTDNVKWSQDNVIAIAGNEQIALLTPKLRTSANDQPTWEQQIIKINAFMGQDLPIVEPLGFNRWSVGEELSQRSVISMAWSLPGLGIFNSCCLAVLHSDWSLDLWECRGRPERRDDWRKCLVISTTVRKHYQHLHPSDDAETVDDNQVRQRIYSFSWEPSPSPCAIASQSAQPRVKSARRIAVSTGTGDILVLKINSPYSVLYSQGVQQWSAVVQHTISCTHQLPPRTGICFQNDRMEQLNWSRMSMQQGSGNDTFTFLSNDAIFALTISLPENGSSEPAKGDSQRLSKSDVRPEGPLCTSLDGRLLFYAAEDTLVVHDIASGKAQRHYYPRGWSGLGGLALGISHSTIKTVYTATHLNYEHSTTLAITLADGYPVTAAKSLLSPLQVAIDEYIARHELSGGVHSRTWGIDAAPTGTHLAYCTNMTPAESITHVINANQTSHVFICSTLQEEISGRNRPMECMVFMLQLRQARGEVPGLGQIISQVVQRNDCFDTPSEGDTAGQDAFDMAVGPLITNVLRTEDRFNDVSQRLAAIITGQPYSNRLPAAWYKNLTQVVLAQFDHLPQGRLSASMLRAYRAFQTRLSSGSVDAQSTESPDTAETCGACDQTLPFEAIKWARCATGHRFSRCAITLLAITQSGASKHCTICQAQYLNEQGHSAFNGAAEDIGTEHENGGLPVIEPDRSPIRLLLSVIDRCILCNGRFVA